MKMMGLARLGRDAELRFTPAGDAVCNLSLAVAYGKKGNDGNRPTQWIDASLWGSQAQALAPFLTKGSVHCFYLSDVHIESFQGQNGPGHKMAARVDSVELGPRVDQPIGNSGYPQQGAPQGHRQGGGQQMAAHPAAPQGGQSAPRGGYADARNQPMPQQPQYPVNAAGYNEPPMNFDDDYQR